jgi:hypothetical protein
MAIMLNAHFALRGAAAMIVLAVGLAPVEAFAQQKPSACVAELKKDYGSNHALRMECAGATDCTFSVRELNQDSLAVVGAAFKRAQECVTKAGLKYAYDDLTNVGNAYYYESESVGEKCALLFGDTESVKRIRLTCQPEKK